MKNKKSMEQLIKDIFGISQSVELELTYNEIFELATVVNEALEGVGRI